MYFLLFLRRFFFSPEYAANILSETLSNASFNKFDTTSYLLILITYIRLIHLYILLF